jgi:ABC-type multidrug transport system permease subunit
MLEVTNQDMENQLSMDFADYYRQSDLYKRNKDLVRELSVSPPGSKPLAFPTEYPLTTFQQLKTILWKQNLTYWRSPDYNLVRFAFTLFTGVICGVIFWQIGTKTGRSTDLSITVGVLFFATLFICFNNASTVQSMVSIERSVHYREKAAGMYSSIPYALSQVLIEVPYAVVQGILYSLITYSMMGFEWTAAKFFWYLYILIISLLQFTYYGMVMVAVTPNVILASILSSFVSTLLNLFSGFFIPRPAIPPWWIWYYWLDPLAWTVYGLIASQFGDITERLIVVGDESRVINVKDYLQEQFGFEHSFMPVVGPMIFVWMVIFGAGYIGGIKYLNFQRR